MPVSASPLIDAGPLLSAHQAIWARLDAFFPPSHFARADVPVRVTAQGWKRLLRRTPFVGLTWRGVAPAANPGRLFLGRSQWSVVLAARPEHAPGARAAGADTGPGLFGMTQVAAFCLGGFTIPDVGSVSVTEVANLTADDWDEEAAAVAGISFDLPFGLGGGMRAEDIDEFLRLGATWSFDPAIANAAPVAADLYPVRS